MFSLVEYKGAPLDFSFAASENSIRFPSAGRMPPSEASKETPSWEAILKLFRIVLEVCAVYGHGRCRVIKASCRFPEVQPIIKQCAGNKLQSAGMLPIPSRMLHWHFSNLRE